MLKTLRQIASIGIVSEPPPHADENLRICEALQEDIRAVLGRHPEYLRRADWFLVDAGTRMQMPDKSHFLQHVAVVVEAGLVDADGDWNAARHDFAYRRYSASQAEIRTRIVANADAVFCDDVQIALA